MGRNAARAGELRAAVDRLPLATRRAMLEGIRQKPIIVGADGDPRGGVCPVYAIANPPSKRIGRPFARAWDEYAGARLPREASDRELRILRSMLETSIELECEPAVSAPEALAAQPAPSAGSESQSGAPLSEAISAHKASQARTQEASRVRETRPSSGDTPPPAARRESGERDRTAELSGRRGWAWLRPLRRYDDYERALQALEGMARDSCPEPEPDPGSEADPTRLVSSSSARG